MDMKTRYVVKGIGKEQIISSVINIYLDKQGKIEKVEDKWDGKLPDGAISNVSLSQLLDPWWWLHYAEAWIFWLWSFVWYTRVWMVRVVLFLSRVDGGCVFKLSNNVLTRFYQAFRRLNAVTVPNLISVPKNKEEDEKKGN